MTCIKSGKRFAGHVSGERGGGHGTGRNHTPAPVFCNKYAIFSKYRWSESYRMSALWIHLEMYPLFIPPVYRSFGKTGEICSQPHQSQQTGPRGVREGGGRGWGEGGGGRSWKSCVEKWRGLIYNRKNKIEKKKNTHTYTLHCLPISK